MAESHISDELWNEFHEVVNMTSRELSDWLRTEATGEDGRATEGLPELEVGESVVAILAKRRTDLTPDDVDTMQHVVDQVRTIRGDEPEPEAYDDATRRALMLFGHDPLRPTGV
jgi:hypothetical protein